jgi:hypothetical protein
VLLPQQHQKTQTLTPVLATPPNVLLEMAPPVPPTPWFLPAKQIVSALKLLAQVMDKSLTTPNAQLPVSSATAAFAQCANQLVALQRVVLQLTSLATQSLELAKL